MLYALQKSTTQCHSQQHTFLVYTSVSNAYLVGSYVSCGVFEVSFLKILGSVGFLRLMVNK